MASFNALSLGHVAGFQSGDYAHLLDVDRAGWAWEWLRRNPEFNELRAVTEPIYSASGAVVIKADEPRQSQLLRWGLHYG